MIRELLVSEKQFSRRAISRDKFGRKVEMSSSQACAWDIFGWIHKCYNDHNVKISVLTKIKNYLKVVHSIESISDFNDMADFWDVRNLLVELNI